MTEFGENGAVIGGSNPSLPRRPAKRVTRVRIAIFLCGLVACLAVALIAAAVLFVINIVSHAFSMGGLDPMMDPGSGRFTFGVMLALMGGALNWLMFYATIPAAWLALGFSIGRFPRRGIVTPGPYRRWGAIWGAILVSIVTAPAAALFSEPGENPLGAIAGFAGGLLGGSMVGGLAGLVCASLFLMIVRPASQIRDIDADVFS